VCARARACAPCVRACVMCVCVHVRVRARVCVGGGAGTSFLQWTAQKTLEVVIKTSACNF
jgi:hypothetical protein